VPLAWLNNLAPHIGDLYASRIYQHDDPELPSVLVSTIKKMYTNFALPPVEGIERQRVLVTPERWTLGEAPTSAVALREDLMPSATVQEFYLLEYLGGGGDGRAWKAVASGGEVCVLKFSLPDAHQKEARRELRKERRRWHALWGIEGVRATMLAGQLALVMPLARGLADEAKERAKLSGRLTKRVGKAVARMAWCGMEHSDLRWRHVGQVTLHPRKPTVVFCDLARVVTFDAADEARVVEAIATMTQALIDDAAREVV
jgi:hypothetical protein